MDLPVLDRDAVLSAVSPQAAIEATRDAFVKHRRGEWVMPSKVYLESPGHGDFRAMPARGGDRGDPQVDLVVPRQPRARACRRSSACSSSPTRRPPSRSRLMDAGAITALRTGAVAAVAATALAREGATTAGIVGCGVYGGWAARCLQAAGFTEGVCSDPRREAAEALAASSGGGPGRARRRSPRTWRRASRPGPSRSSTRATCTRACT
jgi:ornithine cyclodeaminase/alanine dehydrogenase-like protein (mu-crystallin family)